MSSLGGLPEGRAGQALAAGSTVVVLAILWLGAAAPALDWYGARQGQLAAARQRLAHMTTLRQSLPALRREAESVAARATETQILLPGDTDAIAGANLQSTLQNLADRAGISLDSVAMLPAQPVGALRRIGAEISVTATWPTLVALLTSIDVAEPRMVADDLSITASAQPDPGQDVTLQAGLTVSAFRAGGPP